MSFDPKRPAAARLYRYWLGGKDTFTADREAGDAIREQLPDLEQAIQANREFLTRAAAFAAGQGIEQFIDLGCGLPNEPNVHETVRDIIPGARVAYVDHDPVVISHALNLLAQGGSDASMRVLNTEVSDPDLVLAGLKEFIDFAKPCALLLAAVLHFIPDAADVTKVYRDALAPGSCVIISHATADFMTPEEQEHAEKIYQGTVTPMHFRTREEISGLFEGLELVEPGLVDFADWRAIQRAPGKHARTLGYGGVGRLASQAQDTAEETA